MSGIIAGIFTGILLFTFVGGWIWLWNPKHKSEFDDAARLAISEKDESALKGEPVHSEQTTNNPYHATPSVIHYEEPRP